MFVWVPLAVFIPSLVALVDKRTIRIRLALNTEIPALPFGPQTSGSICGENTD
jgi:hypothetical protein